MKRYLTVKEICELLPVCKSLVYRLVRDGQLPSTRFGGKILVPEDELAALLERGQEKEDPIQQPRDAPVRPRPTRRKSRKQDSLELW